MYIHIDIHYNIHIVVSIYIQSGITYYIYKKIIYYYTEPASVFNLTARFEVKHVALNRFLLFCTILSNLS